MSRCLADSAHDTCGADDDDDDDEEEDEALAAAGGSGMPLSADDEEARRDADAIREVEQSSKKRQKCDPASTLTWP